jgi:PAS domain S-box-containing protein
MKIGDLEARKISHEEPRKKINKEITRFETQYRHKNGNIIRVKILTVLIHSGIKKIFISFVHDITEHKEIETKMQFLSYAMERSTDGIAFTNLDGHLIYINKTFAAIHGYDSEELLGKHISIFYPSQLKQYLRISDSQTNGIDDVKSGVWHARRNGKIFPAVISKSLLKDKAGNPIGMVIIIKDTNKKESYNRMAIESENTERVLLDVSRNKDSKKIQGKRISQDFVLGKYMRADTEDNHCFKDIISCSERIWNLFDIIPSVAESVSTVLLQGESGTGKHLFANAIHNLSPRREKPFITLNCGALPDTLLESELFGYKAGAFTDAKRDKLGRFALADGGTLFLDEIGDISPAMQIRLLHFLQERVYEPLGSEKSIRADVRIIAATNKDLMDLVKKSKFRQDLFYRINVVRLDLPPLRERLKDVPLLVEHFIARFNKQQAKKVEGITEDALTALLSYNYPGNIRELENIIEHAFVLCRSKKVEKRDLPEFLYNSSYTDFSKDKGVTPFMKVEADFLMNVLRQNNWNRLETARQLGIHKATLFRKIKSLGLKLPPSGKHSNF